LKVQKKIHVSARTGIPVGVLDGSHGSGTKLTADALARHNISNEENHCDCDGTESMVSALSLLSVRPPDETPELNQNCSSCIQPLYFLNYLSSLLKN
jgi:hypothetical protein